MNWRRVKCLHMAAMAIAAIALSGCEKWRLDAQVKELCAKDGGIRVYEVVQLPADRFDQFGNVKIPAKADARPGDEYYYERETYYYKKGSPELSSSRHKIVRRSDGKVLGEAMRYARGGGDLPGPWHDSTFICPDPTNQSTVEASIFLRGETK